MKLWRATISELLFVAAPWKTTGVNYLFDFGREKFESSLLLELGPRDLQRFPRQMGLFDGLPVNDDGNARFC